MYIQTHNETLICLITRKVVKWNNTVCHFNLQTTCRLPNTRVTENSSTLIDHVYTTNEELIENLSVTPN